MKNNDYSVISIKFFDTLSNKISTFSISDLIDGMKEQRIESKYKHRPNKMHFKLDLKVDDK